jgi:hypothetical protein
MADDHDAPDANGANAPEAVIGGSMASAGSARIVVRVVTPGKPAFQLQKGETGLSVFDIDAVSPPLSDAEILASFRPGSQVVARTIAEILQAGLRIVSIPGDPKLPVRLQNAHAEILPGPGMTRGQFKAALKGLN